MSDPALRLVQCARVNSAADPNCKACGAARWDGDDGQLAARVSAILQVNILGCGQCVGQQDLLPTCRLHAAMA
jgi:hypothetical protein